MSSKEVVSVLWRDSLVGEVWIETDQFKRGRCEEGLGSLSFAKARPMAMTLWVSGTPDQIEVETIVIELRPYMETIVKACNVVRTEGMKVERVTIIDGKVGAHPPAHDHYRCPSCYPKE